MSHIYAYEHPCTTACGGRWQIYCKFALGSHSYKMTRGVFRGLFLASGVPINTPTTTTACTHALRADLLCFSPVWSL